MPSPQHATTSAAYRPTSLDFINLPNPIEPSAGSQRHLLNGTPRFENPRLKKNLNQGLFHLAHDSGIPATVPGTAAGERPEKRQNLPDNALLDLPRLPVRHPAKRLRIPPTLSGLHQPPPDAGLLPSINIEKPRGPQSPPPTNPGTSPEQSPEQSTPTETLDPPHAERTTDQALRKGRSKALIKRPRRTKWTAEETRNLLHGVARFGIGNWTKILNCPDLEFNHRTALDLKDRFRVCRPADYKPDSAPHRTAAGSSTPADDASLQRGNVSEQISASQLRNYGIDQPFTKSSRRQRHGYTRAEDEALLKGFHLYGNSWAIIRSDASLGLSARTATDLRDRFRTRYPDEYANVGLVLRQEKLVAKRSDPLPPGMAKTQASNAPAPRPKMTKKSSVPALLDDVFWGGDFGHDQNMGEGEPIVLDRGILDWAANDGPRSLPTDNVKNSGIDPLMTLKLPRLTSSSQTNGSGPNPPQKMNGVTSLPSIAEMVSSDNSSTELSEFSGLPSIVQWLGSSESEINIGLVASCSQNQDEYSRDQP